MVGGGCRGLDLARDLVAEGHAVRAVTRRPEARAAIEAAEAETGLPADDPVRFGATKLLDSVKD